MANLYLWFPDVTERRHFILDMLEAPHTEDDECLDLPTELLNHLKLLEIGKTSSPYYDLSNRFYMGIVPETERLDVPWAPASVFNKGFRRIYTVNRYNRTPGSWLVVQLRSTDAARDRYRWIYTTLPYDHIHASYPPSLDEVAKWKNDRTETEKNTANKTTTIDKMRRLYASLASDKQMIRSMLLDDKLDEMAEVLDGYLTGDNVSPSMTLDDIFTFLNELKDSSPEIFAGERVYLWEQLGWIYNDVGHLARMEYCLRTQASFQPGCADAFLNLGSFWSERGEFSKAVAAYYDGLKVDPKDEYIYHNLAELYRTTGNREAALAHLNNAILENPGRGINHKLKGDIHFDWGEYAPAILCYEHAVDCFDNEGWHSFTTDCLLRISTAHKMLGNLNDALGTLLHAVMIDPGSADAHLQLAMLYAKELNRWSDAATHARTALEIDPSTLHACFLLAEYHRYYDVDLAKSKWYLKRGKQLENHIIPSEAVKGVKLMFKYVPNTELRLADIPRPDDPMEKIWEFIYTYDAYNFYERCGEVARAVIMMYEEMPERFLLQALTLSALRACLFIEYRRSSWDPNGCDAKWEAYVRMIVDVIREKVQNHQLD